MRYLDDAIDDGVAEVHVGVRHVQLGAQHHRALDGLRAVHVLKQPQVLLHGTVAERAGPSGLRGCALLLGNLFRRLLVNVGQSFLDEPYGEAPKMFEIVGGVVHVLPVEPEPLDVAHDVLHIFRVLLRGVGVVEAQVARAAELLCHAEVHADGLGVSDVDISVRLRREACLQSSTILACFQVFLHKLFYEAEAPFLLAFCHNLLFHCLFYFLSFISKLSTLPPLL